MIDGIINVYKEQGFTSFDVVAKLRGILKQKKIGHTGTLDPMAEGVLMVCLGKATKLVDMLTFGEKEYSTVMRLGISTDTEDITGKVLVEKGVPDSLDNDTIYKCVKSFEGSYMQIPPMYSAIKKDGKKLYEYARAGVEIERESREVSIFSLENISVNKPDISFDVHCSKGTYIRSLCRDIGDKLGTGGTMLELRRDRVHEFSIDNALKLNDIERLVNEGEIEKYILPVDAMLSDYSKCYIKNNYKKYLLNGNKLYKNQLDIDKNVMDKDLVRVYSDDEFLALYRYSEEENIFIPYKMFLG